MSTSDNLPENMKERLKASYDAMAPEYNTWTEHDSPLRLQYLEKLCSHAPKLLASNASPKVVELGCGSCHPFLTTLLSRNPSLTATANDMSSTQLQFARDHLQEQSSRVDFHLGDMTELKFAPATQTAVVALYSIIHLPREEQELMLENVAEWIEKGGCLLATFSTENVDAVVMEEWLSDKGWMFWSGLGHNERLQ